MIHSVAGQNEQWAQLAALQSPPAAQPGQGAGPAFNNVGTAAADPSVVNPVASSTASPLSSNMSFMLMMFGGSLDSATGSGSPSGAGSTAGSGSTTGSNSTTQTVGAPDDTSGTQSGTGLASMLADLQSMMATLTGSTSAATAASASTTPGASATAAAGSSTTGNSLLQDLDKIVSDLGTIVASVGGTQPPPPPGRASTGQPSGGNDITNTASASVEQAWRGGWDDTSANWRGGWDSSSGPGSSWQQQSGLAAYASGNISAATSASQSISA